MFAVRIVYGPNKGKYYAGFNTSTYNVEYSEDVEHSKHLSSRDTASIIMGLIDQRLEVGVPEVVTANDDNCRECAKLLADGMWSKHSGIDKVIYDLVIRKDPTRPIHEQPKDCPENRDNGYMSVWEWLTRAVNPAR